MASKRQILETLADTLQLLKDAGAEHATASYGETSSLSVSMRNGQVDAYEKTPLASGITMVVRVGHKSASVSPNTKRAGFLKDSAKTVVGAALLKTDNPDQAQPDRTLLSKIRNNKSLDLVDRTKTSAENMITQLSEADNAARTVNHVKEVSGSAAWSRVKEISLNSDGDLFESEETSGYVSTSVIAENGGPLSTGSEYTQAMHKSDLRDPSVVGRLAAEEALAELNPRRAPATGQLPVVFAPKVAASLLSHFTNAASAGAIVMNQSFLTRDSLEQQVFAKDITIINNPHKLRGLKSAMFTNDGLPTSPQTLVETGTLKALFLGVEGARRMGVPLTEIKGGPNNLTLSAGTVTRQALIADIKQGFYVTSVMGHGYNIANGNYSRGASGFWIENGIITHPVNEATIAGNLRDMFMNMVAADDLDARERSTAAPTLRVEGMTIA